MFSVRVIWVGVNYFFWCGIRICRHGHRIIGVRSLVFVFKYRLAPSASSFGTIQKVEVVKRVVCTVRGICNQLQARGNGL
jgi:hypothetical protein